jgi:hypothetical protein
MRLDKGYHLYHTADNKIMMESVCYPPAASPTEQEMIDLSDFNIEADGLSVDIEYRDGTADNNADFE